LRSGLTVAPFATAFVVTSLNYRKLPACVQSYIPIASLVLLAVGYATLGVLTSDGTWRHVNLIVLTIAGGAFGSSSPHGHRWSYRQKRCARGSLVEHSISDWKAVGRCHHSCGHGGGRSRELGAGQGAQRLCPRAARASGASSLQTWRTRRERGPGALRAHRLCKQEEQGPKERVFCHRRHGVTATLIGFEPTGMSVGFFVLVFTSIVDTVSLL
jgi:hypothetical protein